MRDVDKKRSKVREEVLLKVGTYERVVKCHFGVLCGQESGRDDVSCT